MCDQKIIDPVKKSDEIKNCSLKNICLKRGDAT